VSADPTGVDARAPAILLTVGRGTTAADPTGLEAGAPALLLTTVGTDLTPWLVDRTSSSGVGSTECGGPPASLPEAPAASLLPVVGAVLAGGVLALRRRRARGGGE